MSYSLYEIDGYQDIAKPSDHIDKPNEYLQDVFHMTRPEVFDFDNDGDGNPYFKYYRIDEDARDTEKSDKKYVYTPHNWNKQEPYTLNLFQKKNGSLKLSFWDFISFRKNIKTGTTFEELIRDTDEWIKEKTRPSNRTRTIGLLQSDPKNLRWVYRVRGSEPWSKTSGHIVTVQLEKSPKKKDIRDLDVKVTCTCPFWQYWGPDYHAHREKYLEGPPRSNLQPPDKRDPGRTHKLCKHVVAIGLIMGRFAEKHRLDTYRDVDKIIDVFEDKKDKISPEVEMEGIGKVIDTLDRAERRDFDPLLRRYDREEDIDKKTKIERQLINRVENKLKRKSKGFLERLWDMIKKFLMGDKKSSSIKKASVDRVLNLYLER